MVKRLYLLRHSHANPEWAEDDHSRALDEHGMALCKAVGKTLAQQIEPLDHVLCSSATRTQQTAELVLKNANLSPEITISQKLYLASAEDIFVQLQAAPDNADSLLVVGHNPGIHLCALQMYKTGNSKAFKRLKSGFPAPALAIFELNIESWGLILPRKATLIDFVDFH